MSTAYVSDATQRWDLGSVVYVAAARLSTGFSGYGGASLRIESGQTPILQSSV